MNKKDILLATILVGLMIGFFFKLPIFSWILFILGLVIGFYFHFFDYALYPFYADQKDDLVQAAQKYFKEKKYRLYLEVILLNQQHVSGLMSRSLIFLLAYFPLAVFVISTSVFSIGRGLVLGLGLQLSWQLFSLRNDENEFNLVFRGGPDQKLSQPQILQLVVVYNLLFLALVVFSII